MTYLAQPFRERPRQSTKKSIRALAADDSPLALAALCSFLETLSAITVVGTALSGYELLQKAEQLDPDLVITDLRMPRMSGLECALHLREIFPAVRIIVLTEMEGPFVRQACLESGADICLHKSDVPEELALAVRRLFPKVFARE
jgi:DNA-binding NarL/FixJ family response regulator